MTRLENSMVHNLGRALDDRYEDEEDIAEQEFYEDQNIDAYREE